MRSAYTGRTCRLPIRLLLAAGLAFLLAACGSSTQLNPGYPVLTMSASNSGSKFASYVVSVDSITLTNTNGSIVSLSPTSQVVDLVKLADVSELVSAFSVPYGTYKSATILLDYASLAANPSNLAVNVDGKPVTATLVGSDGVTAPTTVSVVITFDPAKPLVIALQKASPVHINFDLQAFNSIDTSAATPKVTVEPYVQMNPAAIDSTPLRARGSFVVAQNGYIAMNLRPFYNFSASLGAVLVYPTADAYYNVNGVVYTGAPGLAALASLPETTVVVAYGTLTGLAGPDSNSTTNPTFSAKEIYAGSSQENGLSYVAGMVSARAGNVLTMKGVTLNYYSGTNLFVLGAVVTIDSSLPVDADGLDVTGLSAESLSVGQYLYVSGTAPINSSGTPTYDSAGNLIFNATSAGGGTARLLHTRLWGGLSSATPTSATFDLVTLGIYAPNGYNFAGTGASAPSNPAAYVVNTGALDLSGTAADTLMAIDGNVTAFGSAPPDFTAIAVTPGSAIEQTLVVDWPSGEVAPFSSASSSGYVVNLSKATISASVDDIYTGPVGMSLKSLPASPLITTTGADQSNLQLSIGSTTLTTGMSMFATPAAFYTGVSTTLNGTNKIHRLVASGHYNSVSNTFVAGRISMALRE
jgi:hypothetical protein